MAGQKDFNHEFVVAETLSPDTVTTTTPGTAVDLAGFRAATFVAHVGTVTDGTYAFDPEESDTGTGDWTNIDAGDLSGAFVNATSSADGVIQKVGYLGKKRYIRCNVTVTGSPSDGGAVGITVVKARPRTLPQ